MVLFWGVPDVPKNWWWANQMAPSWGQKKKEKKNKQVEWLS
jgi:hypothetical protein